MPRSRHTWRRVPPALAGAIEGLSDSQLWSALIEVFAERAMQRQPRDVLRVFSSNPFTSVSNIDVRIFRQVDTALFDAARFFEAVELSPVAPLGACTTIAPGSQNRILSALRGTEVVADPTSVLALECACRLRQNAGGVVRLATSHRVLRCQPAPSGKGFSQHFRMFALATAAREQKDHAQTVSAVQEQISVYLRALSALELKGFSFPHCRLTVLTTDESRRLAQRILEPFAEIETAQEPLNQRYYHRLRFRLDVGTRCDEPFPLADGGAFDWLHRLTSNRRLSFVASAIGTQIIAQRYFAA